jgi:hypothetical protein
MSPSGYLKNYTNNKCVDTRHTPGVHLTELTVSALYAFDRSVNCLKTCRTRRVA